MPFFWEPGEPELPEPREVPELLGLLVGRSGTPEGSEPGSRATVGFPLGTYRLGLADAVDLGESMPLTLAAPSAITLRIAPMTSATATSKPMTTKSCRVHGCSSSRSFAIRQ